MSYRLNTAVAFFIFNRPDTTKRVFAEIAKAKPPRLLVVADGPRLGNERDEQKCESARKIIEEVNWDCEVIKNYSNVNLGCKNRVSSGLDWVFKQEEEAIILEDDCLPSQSFFRFCEEMLEYYKQNEQVMMISGFNFLAVSENENGSYFFSKYPHIWGWASWRRVWENYDIEMKRWPELRKTGQYHLFCQNRGEAFFWRWYFDLVYAGYINTWDAQVTFMSFCLGKVTVFPKVNLVNNIGFGTEATHTTTKNPYSNIETKEINFPLKHPQSIESNLKLDKLRQKKEYSVKNLIFSFRLLIKFFLYGAVK